MHGEGSGPHSDSMSAWYFKESFNRPFPTQIFQVEVQFVMWNKERLEYKALSIQVS